MGMFDYIICEYPLPHKEVQDAQFQTKHLNCHMDNYTITKEGRLIWCRTRHKEVPEEERPYYGKPEWDKEGFGMYIYRNIGSTKIVSVAQVDIQEHGSIRFYIDVKSMWYEYEAIFEEGQIVKLITISPKLTTGKIVEITDKYGADSDDVIVYIESNESLTGLHISKCHDFVPAIGDKVNIIDDGIVLNN